MKDGLEETFHLKMKLWDAIQNFLQLCSSKPWEMADLEMVLQQLKCNKARDPSGLISELFKPDSMDIHFKYGLLIFMNGLKEHKQILEFLTLANIHTIYKKKGSRFDMSNQRGIFILSIWRKIADKLLYNDVYPEIAKSMSDSNIGAQKEKNIKSLICGLWTYKRGDYGGK